MSEDWSRNFAHMEGDPKMLLLGDHGSSPLLFSAAYDSQKHALTKSTATAGNGSDDPSEKKQRITKEPPVASTTKPATLGPKVFTIKKGRRGPDHTNSHEYQLFLNHVDAYKSDFQKIEGGEGERRLKGLLIRNVADSLNKLGFRFERLTGEEIHEKIRARLARKDIGPQCFPGSRDICLGVEGGPYDQHGPNKFLRELSILHADGFRKANNRATFAKGMLQTAVERGYKFISRVDPYDPSSLWCEAYVSEEDAERIVNHELISTGMVEECPPAMAPLEAQNFAPAFRSVPQDEEEDQFPQEEHVAVVVEDHADAKPRHPENPSNEALPHDPNIFPFAQLKNTQESNHVVGLNSPPVGDEPMASGLEFRTMLKRLHPSEGGTKVAAASQEKHWLVPQDVKDQDDFRAAPKKLPPKEARWRPHSLRAPPTFYPLEKSTRLMKGGVARVAKQLVECLRILSVKADYHDAAGTASLVTQENIEIQLSLWKSLPGTDGVLVELQRRKGDLIAFHRYSRCILDSAAGEAIAEPMDNVLYAKKVQRLLSMDVGEAQEQGNALMAIEIAHGLLMKDRMDATQLGLESLCLLTDPSKTGSTTALLTAHVVLFGGTQGVQIEEDGLHTRQGMEGLLQEVKTAIVRLAVDSKLGQEEDFDDSDKVELDRTMRMDMEQEHLTLLHNLALAVLSNSLSVIENGEFFQNDPEDAKPHAKTPSRNPLTDVFPSNENFLSTLIGELRQARKTPHTATLSAKCLGALCSASLEAREKAKDAKAILRAALEVGSQKHLKLETECRKAAQALQRQELDP